nr:hypothetical protein CFP56_68403 [Quercus suber]
MNKTKGNLVLTGEAAESGWAGSGDRGRLRWLAGGGDSIGFEVGWRWRQEDLGWPAGGGDRRLWVIGWSWVLAFWVTV